MSAPKILDLSDPRLLRHLAKELLRQMALLSQVNFNELNNYQIYGVISQIREAENLRIMLERSFNLCGSKKEETKDQFDFEKARKEIFEKLDALKNDYS